MIDPRKTRPPTSPGAPPDNLGLPPLMTPPAPIVAPVQRPPQGRVFYWGREDVAVGTPPSGMTGHPIIQEPITNFDVADQRDVYDAVETTGLMSDNIGHEELTHYIQGTLTSPFRMNGVTAQGAACLMGNQLYTPTADGTGHWKHPLKQAAQQNRCNTLSCWWQVTTDPTNPVNYMKQYLRGTVTGLDLTFGPGTTLQTSMPIWATWPTHTPPPVGFGASSTVVSSATGPPTTVTVAAGTGSQFQAGAITIAGVTGSPVVSGVVGDVITYTGGTGTPTPGGAVTQALGAGGEFHNIGSDAVYALTRTKGYQGSFSIYGSSGTLYVPRILNGTLNLSRPAEPVYAADSQTIVDIALGPLSIGGTFTFQFDGYASGTVGADFEGFKPVGSAANPQSIQWTDDDGNYMQIKSFPWRWNPFTLDYSGQFVKATATIVGGNDAATVLPASGIGALTVVQQMVIRNNISTYMIGP